MGFMTTLALASALAVSSLAGRWDTGLSGVVTVQIPPSQDRQADDRVLQDVMETVRAAPGVADAELLDDEAVARLLAPWLGSDLAVADLPVPRLVDVRLADRGPADLAQMRAALTAIAPGAVVDDHGAWIADLKDVAGTVQWVAALAVLLVAAAAVAAVIFVTGSQMAIHRDVIGILHTLGATDSYIARQYQRHVSLLAARGGFIGLAVGVATLLILMILTARRDPALLPGLSLDALGWIALLVVPLATAGLAAVTARVTVLRLLARLP